MWVYLSVIGQQITHAEETVAVRPALAYEAERLNIRPGGIVLPIALIHRTDERAVKAADIIIRVERYALVYDQPVRLAEPASDSTALGKPGAE